MPTNWETAETLRTPLDITWQFDYDIDIQQLKNLYSKSKRMQWDAEVDIDWSQPIDPARPLIDEERFGFMRMPFWDRLSAKQQETFRVHMTAQLLSAIVHGEQGALMTASVLTHAVPDYEGKLYCSTQTMDEARHVEVFERYLRRLGVIYPMGTGLKELIETAFKADHWVKIAIGMNMIVESLALGTFHNVRTSTECETLRKIMQLVLRDEARHVAFGNVYVGETLRQMHPDDREDVAEFVLQAVGRQRRRGGVAGADPQFIKVIEAAGIDPQDFIKGMQEARQAGVRPEAQPGQVHMFNHIMMPALVRVGAITERTREKFKENGIEIHEDTTVLNAMEDSETGIIEI